MAGKTNLESSALDKKNLAPSVFQYFKFRNQLKCGGKNWVQVLDVFNKKKLILSHKFYCQCGVRMRITYMVVHVSYTQGNSRLSRFLNEERTV
jgi:hypothetical protein